MANMAKLPAYLVIIHGIGTQAIVRCHLRPPHSEEEVHTRPWPVVGRDRRSVMKSSALDLYSA